MAEEVIEQEEPTVEPAPEPVEENFVPAPVEEPVVESVPEHFPMGLTEYAATVNLDPMLEAALAVYVPRYDRLQTEWDAILAAYRVLPITC